MIRGALAEISLSAIAHNLRFVKSVTRNRPVIAVVKADAYGHGSAVISTKLLQEGVACLAVAFTCEACELRESGITSPIIVLFDHGDVRHYFDYGLLPVISSYDSARRISEEAKKRETVIQIHVDIDTGMGRLGFSGRNMLKDIMRISDLPGLAITGLMSHFSEADLADRSYAALQLDRFNSIIGEVQELVGRPILSHIANSAAILSCKESHLGAVRPGLMLYGYSPLTSERSTELIPAMSIKAPIIDIRHVEAGTPISYGRTFVTQRPSRIGVLAIGYADGYSRVLSNNAHVLVKGARAPVVGRVCMDLTMIDLTDAPEVEIDDEAVIIGRQGEDAITADDLAIQAGTISYEILTSLGSGSRKVYVEDY